MSNFKIGLFLGAGASNIFGYPTTSIIMDKLKTDSEVKKIIPHSLFKHTSYNDIEKIIVSFFTDPVFHSNKDIEHLLHTIYKLEKLPNEFVTGFLLNKNINFGNFGYLSFSYFIEFYIPIIKEIIHKLVFESYKWQNNKSEFFIVYSKLFQMISDYSTNTIPVFTTNYDSIIEHFCEKNDYNLVDGFNLLGSSFIWNDGEFDALIKEQSKNILLLKLHGSLSWEKTDSTFVRVFRKENYSEEKSNVLIYPTYHPKGIESVEPFATILKAFKNKLLKELNVLVVIGFSFRDQHVNDILFKEFLSNSLNHLIVVSPTATNDVEREVVSINLFNNIHIIQEFVTIENIDGLLNNLETLLKSLNI